MNSFVITPHLHTSFRKIGAFVQALPVSPDSRRVRGEVRRRITVRDRNRPEFVAMPVGAAGCPCSAKAACWLAVRSGIRITRPFTCRDGIAYINSEVRPASLGFLD